MTFASAADRPSAAEGIQSYLGHKSIQHTVRYTELAPTRFKSLFRD
jgi:site-specific recombinase XerD